LTRLADCTRDAQNGIKSNDFPKGQTGISMGSSGPSGYTQGWTLGNDEENMKYICINAKFFERELAVNSMIPRYIYTFIAMTMICLLLCFIIARLITLKVIYSE
jgi:hypothetical protein